MHMSIKLILFDIDNTLIAGKDADKFYNQYYLTLQKIVSSKMGISEIESENIIRKHIRNGFRSETILEKLGISMLFLYNSLVKINPHDYLKPRPTIARILNNLKKDNDIEIGFITDSPETITNKILKSSEIERKIFNIRIGWKRNEKMPKAGSSRVYRDICQKYGLKPNEIIMIGDSLENDILPAKKMGLNTVLIGKTNNNSKIITIHSIKFLPKILKTYFHIHSS